MIMKFSARSGRRMIPVALTLFLAACGANRGADSPIVYNCSANALEISSLNADIPEFTGRTGIKLTLNPFSGDEKLMAMIAAGQAPDIFYAGTALRDRLAAEGKLLDLRTVSRNDPFVARLTPAARGDGESIDGGWYSCGNWAFTCGVYYNKTLFDRAAVPYPDTGWTWHDMTTAAARLTNDKDGDGKTDQYGIFIGTHFVELLEQMNHAPIGRDNLFLSISDEAKQAQRAYLKLISDGIMPDPRRVQAMGMQAPQMLENGVVAMLLESLPNASIFEALTIPWGVAPLPAFVGKPPKYFRSRSGGLCISADTPDPGRAWTALKWIVSEASYYQPNPVLMDVDFAAGWENRYERLRGSGFREVWEKGMLPGSDDPRYFVRFSSWTMHSIMERFQPLLDRLWAGRIGVEEAASAVPSINDAVREDLRRTLRDPSFSPAFKAALERRLVESGRAGGASRLQSGKK